MSEMTETNETDPSAGAKPRHTVTWDCYPTDGTCRVDHARLSYVAPPLTPEERARVAAAAEAEAITPEMIYRSQTGPLTSPVRHHCEDGDECDCRDGYRRPPREA